MSNLIKVSINIVNSENYNFVFIFECIINYRTKGDGGNNDLILNRSEMTSPLERANASAKNIYNTDVPILEPNLLVNKLRVDHSKHANDQSFSYDYNKNLDGTSQRISGVNIEDEVSRVNEFQQYLQNVIKNDSKRYSKLLTKLPCFINNNKPSNTCYSTDEEQYTAFPMHSETSQSFLLKFLTAGNNRFETATKILINYILLMRDNPKYYSNSLKPDVIQKVYDEKIHTVLPKRDKFRRRVFIWRPGKWNPDSTSFTDTYCAMYMLCEMMALEPTTQIKGCTVVCEGSNIGFRQLKSMCIEDIKNSANFIQVS